MEPTQRTNRFSEEKSWRLAHVCRLPTVKRTLGARRLPGHEDQSHPGVVAPRPVHLHVGFPKRLLANTHGKG